MNIGVGRRLLNLRRRFIGRGGNGSFKPNLDACCDSSVLISLLFNGNFLNHAKARAAFYIQKSNGKKGKCMYIFI